MDALLFVLIVAYMPLLPTSLNNFFFINVLYPFPLADGSVNEKPTSYGYDSDLSSTPDFSNGSELPFLKMILQLSHHFHKEKQPIKVF